MPSTRNTRETHMTKLRTYGVAVCAFAFLVVLLAGSHSLAQETKAAPAKKKPAPQM